MWSTMSQNLMQARSAPMLSAIRTLWVDNVPAQPTVSYHRYPFLAYRRELLELEGYVFPVHISALVTIEFGMESPITDPQPSHEATIICAIVVNTNTGYVIVLVSPKIVGVRTRWKDKKDGIPILWPYEFSIARLTLDLPSPSFKDLSFCFCYFYHDVSVSNTATTPTFRLSGPNTHTRILGQLEVDVGASDTTFIQLNEHSGKKTQTPRNHIIDFKATESLT